MKKLSVVISAFNGEEKIEKCLESAKFADEIIVIDNSSIDNTRKIVEKYTQNIISQKNDPTRIDQLKNIGFEKANGDWIFSLDQDEQITKELVDEIKEVLNSNSSVSGYWVPRKNLIFGKWMEHTGWYPDYQLRLFNKGKGEFRENFVHQTLKVEGETTYLKNHLLHENYETLSQFLNRAINSYAPNEAEKLMSEGYAFSYFDAIKFPLKEFLNRFFNGEGYKDGFHGLMLSILMAFYHFIVFANLWEIYKFKDEKDKDMLKVVKTGFKDASKELKYWVNTAEIKTNKNPIKKSFLRVKRKLSSK